MPKLAPLETRLTLIKMLGKQRAIYSCSCGNEREASVYDVRRGHTRSCGCRQAEARREMAKLNTTHGMTETRLYSIWSCMKTRCLNPNARRYKQYGARGIVVCSEWVNSFEIFREWSLSNGYSDNLDLDREDNDGNYEPGNCRWITTAEQTRNKQDTIYLKFGEKFIKTCDLWERKCPDKEAVPYNIFLQRAIAYGWTIKAALEVPKTNGRGFGNHYDGERVQRVLYRKIKGNYVPFRKLIGYKKFITYGGGENGER